MINLSKRHSPPFRSLKYETLASKEESKRARSSRTIKYTIASKNKQKKNKKISKVSKLIYSAKVLVNHWQCKAYARPIAPKPTRKWENEEGEERRAINKIQFHFNRQFFALFLLSFTILEGSLLNHLQESILLHQRIEGSVHIVDDHVVGLVGRWGEKSGRCGNSSTFLSVRRTWYSVLAGR